MFKFCNVDNNALNLTDISRKALMLLLLQTMVRHATVTLLSIDHMEVSDECLIFEVQGFRKSNRAQCPNPTLRFVIVFRYHINTKICPVTAILDYISTTKSFRNVSSLFLTLTPPHAAARPATLGAWTSRLLTATGITGFKPHSTHSASASGALKAGVPVGDVLIRGGWANPHNFFKYYAHTVQVDYSAPAVFKDFFKTQDGKGVHHYALADPVPVAAFRGDW